MVVGNDDNARPFIVAQAEALDDLRRKAPLLEVVSLTGCRLTSCNVFPGFPGKVCIHCILRFLDFSCILRRQRKSPDLCRPSRLVFEVVQAFIEAYKREDVAALAARKALPG
nr:MAG: hypothetical protein [Bacteriophage sp.]